MKIIAGVLTFLMLLGFASMHNLKTPTDDHRKHYIVYMGDALTDDTEAVINANHELLALVTKSIEDAKDSTIYHYTKSFRGFSAMLTTEQADKLRESGSTISVFQNKMNLLHTTHSWNFLGMDDIAQDDASSNSTSDVIVGVIDTGIWPESPSFHDENLSIFPKKFKGKCEPGQNFTIKNCNRKIVGARYYYKSYVAEHGPFNSSMGLYFLSARDSDGHGTHTASTVAGRKVINVSFMGLAAGTARGGAPNARLAIYKVCWFEGCSDADILAAMDDAISDGVDIISMSIGGEIEENYYYTPISIGSFHAFQHGILTCVSAGNNYSPGSVQNVAPWMLTVGASSIDRVLQTAVNLGNGQVLKGRSLNAKAMKRYWELILGSDAGAPGVTPQNASFCRGISASKVQGKILVCKAENSVATTTQKDTVVKRVGRGEFGLILIDPLNYKVYYDPTQYPLSVIGKDVGDELLNYMNKTKNPIAKIAATITISNTRPAPEMATFSSRGPNSVQPDIVKPDVTAPGVGILAAYSPVSYILSKSFSYFILSGTSMACPHAAAIAAILKSSQPTWSPAAIKSAIMTSASTLDNTGKPIHSEGHIATPFDFGSGHVDVIAAMKTRLVYVYEPNDILDFLCGVGATSGQLKNLTKGKPYKCGNPIPSRNLNYPSIGIYNDIKGRLTVFRELTYYGDGKTSYVAQVESPVGFEARVEPCILIFNETGEKRSFKVHFTPVGEKNGSSKFGTLTWSNGMDIVRSPIVLVSRAK